MNAATLRDASEEIGAVEQLLESIGETGNQRADDLLRIASARLGHANGRLLAEITKAETKHPLTAGEVFANSRKTEKKQIGAFPR